MSALENGLMNCFSHVLETTQPPQKYGEFIYTGTMVGLPQIKN